MRWITFLIVVLFGDASVCRAQQIWPIDFDTPLYIVAPGGQTPNKVDFEDFIAFAQAYNSHQGDSNYNYLADTNQDGVVNFADFIAFAGSFGLEGTPSDILPQPLRYSISGRAMLDSLGLVDVGVFLNGFHTVKTDSAGYFQIDRLEAGTYKVKLARSGFQVTPDSMQIEIADADITGLDFAVRELKYMISGTVIDSVSEMGLSGVQFNVQGDLIDDVVSDSLGHFTLRNLPYSRTYYIEPQKEGYIFTPQFLRVEFAGNDTTAIRDFQARPLTVIDLSKTVALDLDLTLGYQGVHQKASSEIGQELILDVVVLGGAMETNGFEFAIEYDEEFLRWRRFDKKDLYSRAIVISSPGGSVSDSVGLNRVKTNVSMIILGSGVERDSGSVGQAVFEVLKPITNTQIYLSNARVSYLKGPNYIIPLVPEKVTVLLSDE